MGAFVQEGAGIFDSQNLAFFLHGSLEVPVTFCQNAQKVLLQVLSLVTASVLALQSVIFL